MKKCTILILAMIGLIVFIGCDVSDYKPQTEQIDNTTEHTHQWQDVSGEHARICTECNEKQLKPEACNFVQYDCEQPAVCTICYAVNNDSIQDHNWQTESQYDGCWYTTITYACTKCNVKQEEHDDLALPNHDWSVENANGKTTFTCARCKESNTFSTEIQKFSYAQILEEYKIGDHGVRNENFNICFESEITGAIDAITIAKTELAIECDHSSVSYDDKADIWRVDFETLDMDGGCQSVFVSGNGMTCYIVYINVQIVALTEVNQYTQEELNENLIGTSREMLWSFWGDPDGMLSGLLGDIWKLDTDTDKHITVYYKDGIVESIKINSSSN